MYHLFLSLAIIVSQTHIEHAKGYSVEEQNIAQHKKNTSIKNIEVAQAKKPEKSENSKIKPKDDSWVEQDIISQLKRDAEKEEKALAIDLESMGLDDIDALSGFLSDENKNDKQIDKKNEPVVANKEIEAPKSNKEDVLKVLELEKALQKEEKVKPTPEIEKPVLPKIEKNNDKDDKKVKSGFNPISKIKNLFKKEPEVVPAAKVDIEKEEVKTPIEEKKPAVKIAPILKKGPTKEEIERKNEEIRKNKIEMEELREQQRMKKMQDIREKYLRKNDEDIFDGISQYQIMGQIVPQQKILPKFINKEVPPPLLNRVRNNDNRHHPFLMDNQERIDFMFRAIARNSIDEFNSLYALNRDSEVKNKFGDTLLTFATVMGRYDAISSLLSKGANPEMPNELGYTPLHIAIELVDYKSVEILISMGAKFDSIDSLGRTYLMQAARVGSLQIVDLLISKGIDVNIEDYRGDTALSIALKHKKDIVVKYLAKFGAKSFIKKEYKENHPSMIEEIFEKWR